MQITELSILFQQQANKILELERDLIHAKEFAKGLKKEIDDYKKEIHVLRNYIKQFKEGK